MQDGCPDYPSGSPINSPNTRMGSSQLGWLPERAKETDDFWYPAQVKPPPHNFSPGNSSPFQSRIFHKIFDRLIARLAKGSYQMPCEG